MARLLVLSILVLLIASTGLVTGPAAAAESGSADSPADLASAAAAVYSQENRGIIGYERHLVQQTTAPGNNDLSTSDGRFVWHDGAFAKMKYSQITDNGRTYSQKDVDSHTADSNVGWMAGKAFFREPFETGHLNDYTYDGSGDAGICAASAAVVHFTSKLRDRQHGDGSMCVDKTTKHVLILKFVPAALPQYASAGVITETLGEALPGTWHVLKIEEHFSGHVLFIHGTLDITADYKDFRRFNTLDEGLASLGGNS